MVFLKESRFGLNVVVNRRFPMPGYPIELDLRGKRVLVIGLGTVGRRKALGLVEAGARVIGVDPDRSILLPGEIEHRAEMFRPEHLDGMTLAVASATPAVNRQVVAEARRSGVWVNAASEPEMGDFTVPAVWRGGRVTLTVSTSGAGPALACSLRDRAVRAIEAGPGIAALLAELRPEVMSRIPDPVARRRLLSDWGDAKWFDIWTSEGRPAVRSAWLEALETIETTGQGTSLPESDDFF